MADESSSGDRLRSMRVQKLESLRERGVNPYPYRYEVSHEAASVLRDEEILSSQGTEVSLAGRIVALRGHGKTTFGHVLDHSGKVQFYVRKDALGEEAYETFGLIEVGDWIGIQGSVFRTKTGELTIKVRNYRILAKALRPLPEKWHGLQDKEIRFRQRYVDLIVNERVRETFRMRSRIVRSIRDFLDGEGFLEVETPVLQPLYGGASARPFVTHHNSLDIDLFLRIADELYLKRLLVGGMHRVYEFCKDFRNEGMDKTHNPEFTMLELYAAFWDYTDIMSIMERMFSRIIDDVLGNPVIEFGGHKIDLSPPWQRIRFFDALREATGKDLRGADRDEVARVADLAGVEIDPSLGLGKMLDALFSQLCEMKLIQPTFVFDYPKELSPLAKDHRSDPGLVERFEPFVGGFEIGNAFSELNDPLEQRRRFEDQARLLGAGDEEAQVLDEDFIRALEYAMPPAGGLGIGIDRVVMLLTNNDSIREVLFFPQLRPETGLRSSDDADDSSAADVGADDVGSAAKEAKPR